MILHIRGNHRNRGRFSMERGGCFGGRALRRALRTMVAPSARASSASSTQDASPYEQPHHYRTRHSSAAPTSKTRQRTSVAREVERVNAHIERRLRELKREPPARFHAPDADASLRPKALRGPKGPRAPDRATTLSRRPTWDDGSGASRDARASSSRTSAARGARAAPRAWPPRRSHVARPSLAEKHQIAVDNASLRRRLENQYRASRDSELVRKGWGRPVDGLAMWAERLRVYDARPPARVADVHPETGKCLRTGVPKSLGVARCAATGLYTYFGADGHPLREHPDVPGLFYCERWYDDFAALDATMQRAIVDYHVSRKADPKRGTSWRPSRPARESWVVNAHMKLALTLMRRLAKGTDPGLTMEEVRERVEDRKVREREEDAARRARQKEMDDMAAFERAAVAGAAPTEAEWKAAAEEKGAAEADATAEAAADVTADATADATATATTVTASTRHASAGKSKPPVASVPERGSNPGSVLRPPSSLSSRARDLLAASAEPEAPRSPPPTDARATTAANDAR